ncbi:glycosyltransferase family 25 protein [Rhodobacteraceae bacterium M385]|nr:glycosyltransferase family 25 protein [Rhodobacteraceae bacterium M385]
MSATIETSMRAQCVPIFAVNLLRANARRELMEKQAARVGVTLQFVEAIDSHSDVGALEIDRLPDFGPWGVFHRHDRACTLSHLKALECFLESGASHGMIMEDDVFLSPDLGAWLADISWWPEGADVVKLERWRDDRLLVALDKAALPVLGRTLRRMRSRHSGGAGYIVTKKAARDILKAPSPNVPIDHLLFSPNVSAIARDSITFQVTPALVVQGNEPPKDPAALPVDRGTLPESKLRKDLLRGWQEVKVMPRLLALWALGRVSLEKITYIEREEL